MQNKPTNSNKQWNDIDKSEFKKTATEILGTKNGKYQNKTLARDTLDKLGFPTDDHNLLESARFFVIYHKPSMLEELEIGNHPLLEEETKKLGIPTEKVKHYWHKGKHFSIFVKNEQVSYEDIRKDLVDELKQFSPKYPKFKRTQPKEGHLLVIDPADVHIGKLCEAFETGEDYNNQIAVQRVMEGVKGILDKSSAFNIDKILFIGGNDILHIDVPTRKTTSGTPQDTTGMWYSNFLIAKKLYIDVLELLLTVADVHFTFNPSNHDYTNGFFLADVISSWFHKNKQITFDCSIAHRKGFKYGSNLIGTTHGDGAKQQDLPLLLAQEFPQWWSETKHRYVYTHHLHHKVAKDFIGVTVESLRTPCGTDSWHHRNGYQHNPKAVEGFLHHKKHGQIARITHLF
jgi:hypothetical protein|tara:strand:- start:1501 stop:2703 length:1203 start_codon:yes stop_codon:yes gene_type:complete